MYVYRFADAESKVKVLDQSSWPMASKMLLPMPCSPDLDFHKEELDATLVWVQFPRMKLQYYTEAGLSELASYIGVPSRMNCVQGCDSNFI